MSSKVRNGLSFSCETSQISTKSPLERWHMLFLLSNSVSFYSSETDKMNPYFQIREDYSSYELPMNKEVK